MSNPVAIRYDFDGYGYKYMDAGSGSDWQTRVDGELLYTHPAKTLTDEEIRALWNPMPDTKVYVRDLLNFARAILKKASEK